MTEIAKPQISTTNLSQIKWGCRRGMLELDMLLTLFLEEVYPQLPPVNQRHFIDLLALPDPTLFAWLMGNEEPNESQFSDLVTQIRAHAKSRF